MLGYGAIPTAHIKGCIWSAPVSTPNDSEPNIEAISAALGSVVAISLVDRWLAAALLFGVGQDRYIFSIRD